MGNQNIKGLELNENIENELKGNTKTNPKLKIVLNSNQKNIP